ncbi:STYKc [Musa troglodytarum]|uniref:non-specific serine/threonine protein kinase n=1 Tax=Musa troglodytarum TaxID=320322 RepID=A0A9E7FBH0_9LILI|nr:STYKc [Musa troglodytarum]
MACFGYFKKKAKGAPERNSFPAVTSATTAASSSSSTSRSDGSAARKHSSISVGSTTSQKSIPDLFEERAHKLHLFTFDELRNATNDFSRMNKIGEGGFGSVYKGYIRHPNGRGGRTSVAIKKLNQKGLQGHKQWLAEVQFLGVFEHPNLVKLVGYCAKDGEGGIERLLVYEYMPNKSLEDHLFKRDYPALPWNLRLQIALGVAEGLAYLHEEQVQFLSHPSRK